LSRSRLAAALLVVLTVGACEKAAPKRPSVILVSIDTLRADHMGLYGYERDTTPFLDRWAKDALVFERAFTAAPWTLIAHMTMLTGLYPEQHGVQEGDVALNEGLPILAERLQRAGYHTIGLYHPGWIHERYGFARGFDVFRGHGDAIEAGEHLAEEVERLDRDQPFFLFLHLFDVHSGAARHEGFTIYTSPAPFHRYFLGDDVHLEDLPYEELRTARDGIPSDARDVLVKLYDGGIRHVDSRLEAWFGELEKKGLLDDTLVIVTADHGESLWQRGRFAGHGGVWQEGVHVPLIVRPPRDGDSPFAGRRVSEPAHLIDIVPTVLDAVGLPPDERLRGSSLLQALPARRALAGFHPPVGYVVDWPRKIMTTQRRFVEVDLDRDPGELQRADVTRADYEALRTALPDLSLLAEPRFIGELPEDEKQALRDLGYAGEVDGE